MDQAKRLQGKRAIVTGAGTGIGKGIALEFGRQGADVALHYAHSGAGAAEVVAELRRLGVRAEAFPADFAEVEPVQRFGREALDFLGGLDILVNNAGITMNRPFDKVTVEQFDTLYHVNVRGQFFLTQTVLPAMLGAGKGAIVNITSIHAFQGFREHSVYAGTKGAIVAYTRELAIELAPQGIRVNAIAPGAVPVENYSKVIKDFNAEAMGPLIPAGFAGTPADIARVAVFLASDDSRYILGQTLIVDGGTTAWLPFADTFRQSLDACFGKGYVPGL